MTDLKPNGPPLFSMLAMRRLVFLVALLIGVTWALPAAFAEEADDLEVEGTLSSPPVIHKISHRVEEGVDIFTFSFRGSLADPSVEVQTDGVWVTLEGCDVDLPPGSEGEFSTPVKGELVGRLDVFVDAAENITRIGLISLSGEMLAHELSIDDDGELIVSCYADTTAHVGDLEEPIPPIIVEPVMEEPEPMAPVEIETPVPTDIAEVEEDITLITKVKYDPVGSVDRLTFQIEGSIPMIKVSRLNYPDRLNITLYPAVVQLPPNSGDRFETPVPGVSLSRMEAVNIAGGNASAGFTFQIKPSLLIEHFDIDVDSSIDGMIIVDISYDAPYEPELAIERPIGISDPVPPLVASESLPEEEAAVEPEVEAVEEVEIEVAPVIEEEEVAEPEPAMEPEPVVEEITPVEEPEAIEEPEVIEETEPIEAVEPAEEIIEPPVEEIIEPMEIEEPEPAIEEPVIEVPEIIPPEYETYEPEKMSIRFEVSSDGPNRTRITLRGDEPFEAPEVRTLGYPTRISLRLPYAEIATGGDDQGRWQIDIGVISRMRAGDFSDEEQKSSTLFIYIEDDVEPDRISTDINSLGRFSYILTIDVEPEPVIEEVIVTEPEPIEEPEEIVPPEDPVEVEEEPEAVITIEIEEYYEPEPVEPEPVEEALEIPAELPEEIEIEEIVVVEIEPEPAIEEIEMIEPMDGYMTETPHQLELYETFSVACFPNDSGSDRFVFHFDGEAKKPEIKWFNHPARMALIFEDIKADAGSSNPYDYTDVDGGIITNRYQITSIDGVDSISTMVVIDANVDSSDDIGVDIDMSGSSVIVKVYPEAGEPVPVMAVDRFHPEPVQPETPPDHLPSIRNGIETLTTEEESDDDEGEDPGEPIVQEINVKDGPVVDVLMLICQKAEITNMIDPSVTGRVSLSLARPMVLSKVLSLLGDQAGFSYYIKDGVYIFAAESVLEQKFPDFFKTWIIELSYADPNQVRDILSQQGIIEARNMILYQSQSISGPSNDLYTAGRKLLVRSSETDFELAVAVIREMDKPPSQIMYDVRIIQTSGSVRENLGISWLTNASSGQESGTFGLALTEKDVVEPDVGGITEWLPQGMMRDPYTLNATLNYLQETGQAKLLANPTISALNGQPANYFVGQTVPYRSTFQVSDLGRVTQRIANEQIGITLNIIGFAASNNTVTMFISPDISNLLELTDIGPRTSNNRFSTTMRVKDGETFVMAGLINREERISKKKVPIMGDIPLIGGLFRSTKTDLDLSELIITITPHIIPPLEYEGPVIKLASDLTGIFTN